jgi:hypothetical protein
VLPSVLGLQRREQSAERMTAALLLHAAARSRTAGGLAAASTGVASGLAAAVAGVASGLAATVTSVAGRLAAAVASVARRLAAARAAAAVLPLALREQALETTEQVVLLALLHAAARRSRTARRLAAARTGVAGRLRTAVAGSAGGLAAAVAGVAAGLAATSTGVAAGLTARSTALVAEHPIEELETEGLATNGHAEDQRAEIHHTLHRATSPLLVDHRCVRPARDAVTPRL